MKDIKKIGRLIHNKRFIIMQRYLLLYSDRLRGEPCLHEKFSNDEILPSSEEGQTYMETIMEVELEEQELVRLCRRYLKLVGQQHQV